VTSISVKQDEDKRKKEKEKQDSQLNHHIRDTRANAAYLRTVVAEVNMMRSQEIAGPLRPRRVPPKRLDRFFMHRPSPPDN
jgi:hypothetical protein